ncbi:MAG TPA: short-chain fatty acyl-CoA regulator family protein, partial [Sphingomicrobium sp.]|nr:short-chain fatty acyl-CoA regulator family protein [Sphingomicrobium sp.]
GRFLRAAEEHRYAMDRLCGQFGANVEQIAHRMTTLGRSGARGVPFFMLRVDPAGNISKRYAGENFPFSHFGGTCPRWSLHAAFQTPGQTIRQLIETPDGQRFFTISRTIERPIRPELRDDALLAIGLGCDVRYAPRIAYADGLDLANTPATPVGPHAQSAREWSAPIGRCRRPVGCLRCTRIARRSRLSRSCPARELPARARA